MTVYSKIVMHRLDYQIRSCLRVNCRGMNFFFVALRSLVFLETCIYCPGNENHMFLGSATRIDENPRGCFYMVSSMPHLPVVLDLCISL